MYEHRDERHVETSSIDIKHRHQASSLSIIDYEAVAGSTNG
jgi:hypothetical protein